MSNRALATELNRLLSERNVVTFELKDDGTFPNSKLPLLVYRGAVVIARNDPAAAFEELFASNGWCGLWRNGIYSYHHYHSTAHEVLGVYRGSAKVQLGGVSGIIQEIHQGDVLIIPAGVAHKNLGSSGDFGVVGAYPEGQDWDMNYGRPDERSRVDTNIAHVPLPKTDPIYGIDGPLRENWRGRQRA